MIPLSSLMRATYDHWLLSYLLPDPNRWLPRFHSSFQRTSSCVSSDIPSCRDDAVATLLKIVAIASILVAGSVGVALPIVGKTRNLVRADGAPVIAVKSFAAGVILATGFVHMLPSGDESLSTPCLSLSKFPFSGFFAMLAGLLTLLFDFSTTRYYETKHRRREENEAAGSLIAVSALDGVTKENLRQGVISQILELGIVSHSIIIGLSLGVSTSPCTIRPLIAALSFHQMFEGFALGGCIAQAEFKALSALIMAGFFALTTPAGIAVGMAVASLYNSNSPMALVTEGVLDSLSAGILIYMSLVDLISDQFLGSESVGSFRQQLLFYGFVVLGSGLMSALAIWA